MQWRRVLVVSRLQSALRVGVITAVISVLVGLASEFPGMTAAYAGASAWTTSGPQGGAVNALAVTPNGSAEFAATSNGGLMKSTNGGSTWTFSNGGIIGGDTSSAVAIAIQTSSPNTMYMSEGGEVFKSTNGGSTFSLAENGITENVLSIAIDQANPLILYAATDYGGVFRSLNGGSSWFPIDNGLPLNGQFSAVRVDPTKPAIVYAVGPNGIYKCSNCTSTSTSSPPTWAEANGVNGIPAYSDSVSDLAVDPKNDAVLLAATSAGVYKSLNEGASWVRASGIPSASTVVFGPYGSVAYAGSFGGVYKSTTNKTTPTPGSSWSAASSGIPSSLGASGQAIAIDPATPTTVFVGLSYPFGVYKSTNSATSWVAGNGGINQLGAGPIAALNSTTFLVGANGTPAPVYKTTNDGATFTASDTGLPIFASAEQFQVISATKVYVLTYAGVYLSTNGGGSWALVPNSNSFFGESFVVDQTNNSHIDVLTFSGIEVTTNGGSRWTFKSPSCFPPDTSTGFSPLSLAMQPTNGQHSVLVTSSGVFYTVNDWGTCSQAAPGTVPSSPAGAAFDPFSVSGATVWVWGIGASKATFGSSPLSFSAVTSLNSDPISSLFFNQATKGNILVAIDGTGVLQSTNDGTTFQAVTNSGLVTTGEFNAVAKAGSTIVASIGYNSVAVIS
jgi:photosystem II stability/assembly factor-like uncharacterized protein